MTSLENTTMTLKDKGKEKINEWKQFADEFNTQLQTGVADAEQEFEKQKNNLTDWLDSFSNSLPSVEEISSESKFKLKSLANNLRRQTSTAKAETTEALKEQQRNIANGLKQLNQEVDQAMHVAGEKSAMYLQETNKMLDHLHTRMDLFGLQMHLGKAESREMWEEKKKDLGRQLNKIKGKLENQQERAAENWDHFASEMGTAWQHFKNALVLNS
jgi:hypothetical protein